MALLKIDTYLPNTMPLYPQNTAILSQNNLFIYLSKLTHKTVICVTTFQLTCVMYSCGAKLKSGRSAATLVACLLTLLQAGADWTCSNCTEMGAKMTWNVVWCTSLHSLFSDEAMCSSNNVCSPATNCMQFKKKKKEIQIGSRFMTIHFYDRCRVGPTTPHLWCITVTTQSVLSLLSALLALFRCACVSSFSTLMQFY